MKNKTCLITGANDGIGFMTAKLLAQKGAHIIMACRNKGKAKIAQKTIIWETGNENVDVELVDLSSQQSIRSLAERINIKHQKLDVLINNAGAVFGTRQFNEEGIEMQFAINHLAYFLLTNLLLDLLKASAPARIVNVSSDSHLRGKIDFDNLYGKRFYSPMKIYAQSKLANVLFTYELARRLDGTGVTANCVHPGRVKTSIGEKHFSKLLANVWRIIKVLPATISLEEGAATSVYLASSPEVAAVSGKYFVKCKPTSSAKLSHDPLLARKLWHISEEMTDFKTEP